MGIMDALRSIRWSRVLIIAMIIVMPIFIFMEFWYLVDESLVTFDVPLITDPAIKDLIIRWVAPGIYAFGWVFILLLFATRTAETVSAVATSSRIIPMRMRLFYTINALFLAMIFVFPVATPFISIFAFASLGWRLTTFRVEWDSGKKVGAGTYIVMILFAIPPALLAIIYIPATFDLALHFWNDLWLPWVVDYLYKFSMCLATSLTFGSLIYFIQTGASEYEQAQMTVAMTGKQKSFAGAQFLQVVIFFFLLYLEWKEVPIKALFYWVGLLIVIFISIIGLVRRGGSGVIQFDKSYFLGYLLTAAFFVGELWRYGGIFGITWDEEFFKSALLIITAVVYIVIFVYKFLTYEEESVF
ncbi:MAG: hypothetical protein RBG13Loki_3882 [Promethearchaeota archaeon CR_4]|nr:MAG: hypothetical protein RBG13Loki_3882 [Candidatus Lokiarchaeota archaeon CR_4]